MVWVLSVPEGPAPALSCAQVAFGRKRLGPLLSSSATVVGSTDVLQVTTNAGLSDATRSVQLVGGSAAANVVRIDAVTPDGARTAVTLLPARTDGRVPFGVAIADRPTLVRIELVATDAAGTEVGRWTPP
jgi:hypothetical protein